MSKKSLIIIISLTLGLLLVVLVGYYFIIQNSESDGNETTTGFKNFFPFGGNDTPIQTATTGNEPEPEEPNFTQKLRKLSSEHVAGAGIVDVKNGLPLGRQGSVVRYIEKATGHIFEVELFSPRHDRISNTTLPVVYEAIFGNKNNSLIARYLKEDNQTIDTYSLTIKSSAATTTENNVSATVFPLNIKEVSVFGDSIFYLQENDTASVGFISNFAGTKKVQIWNSPIKEILSQYVNTKTVALSTKPAQNIPGYLYFVDTGSGQVRKVLSNIAGLSTLADSTGTTVLYLEQKGSAQMFAFDTKNKSTEALSPATFPEKCVWSKLSPSTVYCAVSKDSLGGESLTNWYKGLISFNDDIWQYDVKNNISGIIENLSYESGESIDVIKPVLSENEQYLIFINKRDGSLWSLDLTK